MDDNGDWVVPKYDEAEIKRQIYPALLANGREKFHFLCFTDLIEEFKEIQGYFCQMKEISELEKAKQGLNSLIGEENLMELDELYPEIMRIGKLDKGIRTDRRQAEGWRLI